MKAKGIKRTFHGFTYQSLFTDVEEDNCRLLVKEVRNLPHQPLTICCNLASPTLPHLFDCVDCKHRTYTHSQLSHRHTR